jgi:protocatechuate 3,4-dioxygenase, alpha subunit
MSVPGITPSQTVGPFFHRCLLREVQNVLVQPGTEGEPLRIEGRVLDGSSDPVADAVVELWQANCHGRYNHPFDQRPVPLDAGFSGFGRTGTDDTGGFFFETVKPGRVPFDETAWQAPHICVTVLARGLLNHLSTRMYFADDPANAADPVLERVPPDRRPSLMAQRTTDDGRAVYRFDIILQGAAETAFFNL